MRPTMTRRQVLRASGGAAVGLTGVLALAACGETEPTVITKEVPVETTVIKEVPVETIVTRTEVKEVPVDRIVTQEKIVTRDVPVEKIVIKEVPVEKIVVQTVVKEVPVEKIVERIVEVEVQPQRPPVRIRFGHDHVSGVRGAQMKWALDRFAQLRPDINVNFRPNPGDMYGTYGIRMAAGTQEDIALMHGHFLHHFVESGAFTLMNEPLRRHPDWDPEAWWFDPDTFATVAEDELPINQNRPLDSAPLYGLPYQGNVHGIYYNLNLMEENGIEWPTKGRWGLEQEYLDAMTKATDADKGTWGLNTAFMNNQAYWGGWCFAFHDDPMAYWRDKDNTTLRVVQDGGDKGVRYFADLVHKHKVAFEQNRGREVSGEFGDAFSSGNTLQATGWGTDGRYVNRIAGRFRFSLGPLGEGPNFESPVTIFTQPHLVTSAAEAHGVVEQTADMLMFWSGIEVQTRFTVDRGSAPVLKKVFDMPELLAAPPENYVWYKEGWNLPQTRAMQESIKGYEEQLRLWRNFPTVLNGEEGVDQWLDRTNTIMDNWFDNHQSEIRAHQRWVRKFTFV